MRNYFENVKRCGIFFGSVLAFLSSSGCALLLVSDDEEDDKNHVGSTYPDYSYYNDKNHDTWEHKYYNDKNLDTWEHKVKKKETTCEQNKCIAARINVYYLLDHDLGNGNSVIVEAFDNQHFSGNPVSSSTLTGFDASAPGSHQAVTMHLDTKLYYFRAYIANNNQTVVPYEYSGMQLVSNQPMGIYGALSDLKSLDLRYHDSDEELDAVDIYLDKLFKKNDSESPSEAYLRLLLALPNEYTPPYNRNLRIELHQHKDFAFAPLYTFSIPSENFLVDGRTGSAEFVSPQLPEGKYYLNVYLDENGNGYADPSEPIQTYLKNNEPARIEIIAKRTATLELQLEFANTSNEIALNQ